MGKANDSRHASGGDRAEPVRSGAAQRGEKRSYEKPRLRRYDQIDQVKPYGPSEL